MFKRNFNNIKILSNLLFILLIISSIGTSFVINSGYRNEHSEKYSKIVTERYEYLDNSFIEIKVIRTENNKINTGQVIISNIDKAGNLVIDRFNKLLSDIKISHSLQSIQMIVNNSPGITISDADFSEPLLIMNSPGVLIRDSKVHDITQTNNTYAIKLINSNNSKIQDVIVSTITSTGDNCSGIVIENSPGVTISGIQVSTISSTSQDLTFQDRNAHGIDIIDSENITISSSTISNIDSYHCAYGIKASNSPNLIIEDSLITDINSALSKGVETITSSLEMTNSTISSIYSTHLEAMGVEVSSSSDIFASNNTIKTISSPRKLRGLAVNSITEMVNITGNVIESLRTTSVQTSLEGITILNCDNVLVNGNNISDITSSFTESIGIVINDSKNLEVLNNSITNIASSLLTSYGILVSYAPGAIISGNLINNVTSTASFSSVIVGKGAIETTSYSWGLSITRSSNILISSNSISLIDSWLFIDDYSENTTYISNIINGITSGLTSFIRPKDIEFLVGETGHSLSWIAEDTYAANYSIFKDEQLIINSSWDGTSSPITINVDNNTVGLHHYLLVLTENNSLNITDEVIVKVVEEEIPTIIQAAEDIRYQLGSSKAYLNWVANDSYPDTYYVYRNGSLVDLGSWTTNVTINISVVGLSLGVYNYTIVIYDTSGNYVKDTAYVFVLEEGTISIVRSMDSPFEIEFASVGNFLNWTVQGLEGGSYSIYRDGTLITTGAYTPWTPIVYPIDGLSIGSYNYTIIVVDNSGNRATDSVIINVINTNTALDQESANQTSSIPNFTSPPYLSRPPAEFPWLTGFGILTGILLVMGSIVYATRRYLTPKAIRQSYKRLKKAKKISDKIEEGIALSKLGKSYQKMGNHKKAVGFHEKALKVFKKVGDKKGQLQELENLGDAYFAIGAEKKNE